MAKRTAVLQPKSMKLQWVMSPERVPREAPEGDEAVEWQLQLEATPTPIRVTFSAADYRRLLHELGARSDAMVTLDGFLVGDGAGNLALERVRFKVDRRRGGGGPKP
ncbi:MAG TPA: hypothetical protein VGK67_35180 [Myxococcales bacterium]|jgi:hypothetical protein